MTELKVQYLDNYDKEWDELKYAYVGDACFDLRSANDTDITLKPMQRFAFPTGIKVEFPAGFELRLSGRSGLALKNGLGLVNGIGVIDSQYRGEIKAIICNFSDTDVVIARGERIVQARLCELVETKIVKVDQVNDETCRKDGGFGSSGSK